MLSVTAHHDQINQINVSLVIKNGWHVIDLKILRRNPIEDGAISGFSGQKSVPE